MSELARKFPEEVDLEIAPELELVEVISISNTEADGGSSRETSAIIARTALTETVGLEDGVILASERDDTAQFLSKAPYSFDGVKDYLNKIGRTPLLRAEQEVELAKAIEVGVFAGELIKEDGDRTPAEIQELYAVQQEGKRAYDHLVNANLRLVVSQSKRYFKSGMPQLDLIQEGNLGLIRAVQKFDYTKGFKFSTYAVWWIRQSIERAIADKNRTIRIPVHAVENINKIRRRREELQAKLLRFPTDEEVAHDLDMKLEKFYELDRYTKQDPISLNKKVGEDEESELGELIADERGISPEDAGDIEARKQAIEKMLSEIEGKADDEEGKQMVNIVRLFFGLIPSGETHSYVAIGTELNIHREKARVTIVKFLKKIRNNPRYAAILSEYL